MGKHLNVANVMCAEVIGVRLTGMNVLRFRLWLGMKIKDSNCLTG